MNKTPLRVVAIDESPRAADDHSAAPTKKMTDNEAITRKVPNSAKVATEEIPSDKLKRFGTWQIALSAGAAALVVGVVVVALVTKGKGSEPAATESTTATAPAAKHEEPPQPQPAPPAPAPAAAQPAEARAAIPETIRLQISAEPVEAELSLDGNVLAGHRLNLEVPRDRGIHVVSASAPGYIPFNQQVSFSSDIVLNISLRRGHGPAPRQVVVIRQRAAAPEVKPKVEVKPAPAAPQSPGFEPGMNMDRPAARPYAKPIDERNPYR